MPRKKYKPIRREGSSGLRIGGCAFWAEGVEAKAQHLKGRIQQKLSGFGFAPVGA
jgi:hypothetical protein